MVGWPLETNSLPKLSKATAYFIRRCECERSGHQVDQALSCFVNIRFFTSFYYLIPGAQTCPGPDPDCRGSSWAGSCNWGGSTIRQQYGMRGCVWVAAWGRVAMQGCVCMARGLGSREKQGGSHLGSGMGLELHCHWPGLPRSRDPKFYSGPQPPTSSSPPHYRWASSTGHMVDTPILCSFVLFLP